MAALTPAADLAATNPIRHPNESDEYRRARQALLVEEIELRRHAERVAELRRGLPSGGEVPQDYRFVAEDGAEVSLARPVRRARHARRLQLHVRSAARRAVPDVHVVHGRARPQDRRHPPARRHRLHRPLADRSARRRQAGTGLDRPAGVQRRAGDFTRDYVSAGRRRHAGVQRVHAARRRRSGTSGATRSPARWPTPARIHAAPWRWTRCGSSSTPCPTAAAATGTPASRTDAPPGASPETGGRRPPIGCQERQSRTSIVRSVRDGWWRMWHDQEAGPEPAYPPATPAPDRIASSRHPERAGARPRPPVRSLPRPG